VKIAGPRSVLSKVASIEARITNPTTIEQTTVFDAVLVALDAEGNELDMAQCEFVDLSTLNIKVTVPVEAVRVVDFSCTVLNTPTGLSALGDKLITISPPSITVIGTQANVDAFANSVKNLLTVNFDELTPDNLTQTISIAEYLQNYNVREQSNTQEIAVSVNVEDFAQKEFELQIGSKLNNIIIQNVPEGMTAQVSLTTVKFTVVGKLSYLNRIRDKDFTAELLLQEGASDRGGRASVRIHIAKDRYDAFKDMWVYYGDEISCYVVLE
jgi:YbbR domain-containing protein